MLQEVHFMEKGEDDTIATRERGRNTGERHLKRKTLN